MSRFIDANLLKEKILEERDKIPTTRIDRYSFGVPTPNRDGNAMRGGIRKALRCLEQTPTADVVEVVRCADCQHYIDGKCYVSNRTNKGVYPRVNIHSRNENDYCSYGERRTEE